MPSFIRTALSRYLWSQAQTNMEYEAYEACITHLNYSQREQMYAMTVIGTMARPCMGCA